MSGRSVRTSAAMFAVASLPATLAIVAVGGIVGIAPVLVLLAAMIVLGRVPGEESLQRLIQRFTPPRARRPVNERRPAFTFFDHPVRRLLLASALAERGPPPALALTR